MTEAADLVAARVSAKAQGRRVEALSERTEFLTTFVNPNGTLTTDASSAPVRFRDETSGGWRPVDLTLREVGGQVVPTSSNVGVSFSAGGAAGSDFVSVEHEAAPAPVAGPAAAKQSRTAPATSPPAGARSGASARATKSAPKGVAWALGGKLKTAKLPKPTLSGTVATYPNVAAGVDLRLTVRPSGFEQDFLLKTRASVDAVTAAGGSWSIPLTTNGLKARPAADGGVDFLDAQGALTSRIPAAHAWDASLDPRSGEPVKVPVTLSVAQSGADEAMLTVKPDPAWLADPARAFPITIDPSYANVNSWAASDTWVATNYPTSDLSGDPELKVGTFDGGTTKARSFIMFPIAPFRGLQVISANLSLWETHSFSCTPSTITAYNSGGIGASTNWGNQPTIYQSVGSATVAKGFSSSCPGGRFNIPITGIAQQWSGSSNTYFGIALKASETDSNGWKRFSSADGSAWPYVSITYNRKPNTPAMPAVATPPAVSYVPPGSTTPVLFEPDSTPTFTTSGSDPDASDVKYTFEVHNTNTGLSASTLKGSCTTGLVASGASASCTLPTALPENVIYYVRALATDREGLTNPTGSAMKQFRTSYGGPRVPTISCPAPYTNGSWQQNVPAASVTCTITANASGPDTNAASQIDYKLDGVAAAAVKFNQSTSATVAKATVVVRNTRGGHSITATSKNPAGRVSAGASYSFGYGDANLTAPLAPAAGQRPVTTGAITVAAAGPPRGTSSAVSATVRWRLAGSGTNELTGWNTAPTTMTKTQDDTGGVKFTGAWDTSTATEDLYLDSDPTTAGVQMTVLNPRVPVQLDVQVCIAYTGSPSVTQCTWSDTASKTTITRVPHAFGGGFPTAAAGPGQVALFTGEFNTSATDVSVPGYNGALSLGRSHSTYSNNLSAAIPPAASVFGPGWTASLQGGDEGLSGLSVYDASHQDGTIAFVDEDGSAMIYAPANGLRRTAGVIPVGTWTAVDDETKESGITLAVTGTGTGTTLTLKEDDATTTAFTARTAPAASAAAVFAPAGVTVPGNGSTSYGYDASNRVTRILAPNPELNATDIAAACPAATEVPGCRALSIDYAAATNAATGAVAGQVSQVSLRIYNPAATLPVTSCAGATVSQPVGMVTVPVACYTYDATGGAPTQRLLSVKDPRNGLSTTYTYGAQNELTSVTPAGQDKTTLTYATLESRLKLTSVTRVLPSTVVGGGAGTTSKLARFVYSAPLSGAGLPDLSAAGVKLWGQSTDPAKLPTKAFAVFGPDHTGLAPGESGYTTGVDWTRADLSYTTTDGYTVNTASYGAGRWLPTRTDYDDAGRVVFTLDADAITEILDSGAGAGSTFDASPWGATTIYSPDTTSATIAGVPAKSPAGSVITDTYAPVRTVWAADGSNDLVRPHTHTDYDQGAPNGGIDTRTNGTGIGYALPTTVTTTSDPGDSNQPGDPLGPVTGRTFTSYLDKSGSATSATSGWTLRAATKSTTDMNLGDGATGPAAGDISAVSYFDDKGRTIESRQPNAAGGDAGTTLTTYYTAAANAADSNCGSKPQWAGLVCRSGPAGQPTVTASTPKLTNERTSGYSYLLAPTSVTETNGADDDAAAPSRTTTTTYLLDGRTESSTTTVANVPGSTALDGTVNTYYPATGLLEKVERKNGVTVTGTITTTYDSWGRPVSTSSSAGSGDNSGTEYNALGQVTAIKDSKGITRYTYDGAITVDNNGTTVQERRGLVTKVATTRVGLDEANPANVLTYTGGYDVDGNLIRQTLPGGLVQQTSYDEAGQPTGLTYSGQVAAYTEATDPDTGVTTYTPGDAALGPWMAWTQHRDANGRIVREYNGQGAAFDGQPGVVDPSGTVPPTPIGQAIAADLDYAYDQAGRLTRVQDRTGTSTGEVIDPETAPTGAFPCAVRTYSFDANGNRTGLTSLIHTDGDCANSTTGASTLSYAYDAADRPTTSVDPDAGGSQTPTGSYVYDALGRQTTLPAADAPDPAEGTVTLGYYDNDLPRTITQSVDGTPATTTATTITLDPADRRTSAVTTRPDGSKTTTVRHYTDTGDNPAWTDTSAVSPTGVASPAVTTRYTETLTGDLGAQIDDAGTTTLSLANPHGDTVTTVIIPAGGSPTANAVSIGPWADYTEYGQPNAITTVEAMKAVGGTIGYGWLGAKQRSTTDDTAGLTLMGVRLYNNTRGLFTAVDPVVGGNETPYGYPNDPVNSSDLDGRCPWCLIVVGVLARRVVTRALVSTTRVRQIRPINRSPVRLPKPGSTTAVTYRATPHIVYRIHTSSGRTWKYGISRTIRNGATMYPRPQSQLRACESQMKASRCSFKIVRNTNSWLAARMWESAYIYGYWKRHGRCPKGNPICM